MPSPDGGQPTFSLEVVIQGQGVVTSDPAGIDCGQICAGQFAAGEKIALSAKAATGWSFSGFSGGCFGPTCAIVKSASTQIFEAVFTQDRPPAGTSSYTIVETPPVAGASGGTFAALLPMGINSLGQVVGGFNDCVSIGMSECNNGPLSAFLYDPGSGTTLRIAHPDAIDHTAHAITDTGAILLNGNPRGAFDGFLLSNGKAIHFGDGAIVDGINPKGWVSGTNDGPGGQFAFLWDGATARQIGPAHSLGGGMNGKGEVAGAVLVDRRFRASVFAGGAIRDLGTLSDRDETFAVAINDRGRVVGTSEDDVFIEHAFVFDAPDGPMQDVLPHGSSSLSSVNAAGDAVGSILERNSPVSAILWHEGTVVELTRALNDPSWLLLSATAINDKGQICGSGIHDGKQHAYVLTPR